MGLDPVLLAQLTLNGIATGAIYGLVALGLVLTYKATEVLNFAQGDLLVAGAFIGWALIALGGVPYPLAVVITVVAVGALAWGVEAGVVRRIAGQPQFSGVMLTIALAFMLRGLISMVFGPDSRSLPTPFTGQTVWLGPVAISAPSLVVIVVAGLVTLLAFALLRATTLGVAIQAASQNQLAAYLSGIPVKRLNSFVWAGAGAVAGLCGLLLAPMTLVDLSLWTVLLKALAAMVLGGFGSIPGALIGGLLIGLIEQFSGVFMPDGIKDIVAYIVLIAVLVLRPHGLFGEAHGRRV
jgi:branched-chain amino acid transport system permease protein